MDLIKQHVYYLLSPQKRTHNRSMKVLALGMSRSRTESLSRALRILRYNHVFHVFEM